jgi:hypothetical protein
VFDPASPILRGMRYQLFAAHDAQGGPFAIVVKDGAAPPDYSGLHLTALGDFELVELLTEIEVRGLSLTPRRRGRNSP